jgi:acetyl esterase/lipase
MNKHRLLKTFWNGLNSIEDRIALLDSGHPEISILRNLTYTKYSKDNQTLDLLYPLDEKESYPVILLVHGGGFVSGNHTRFYLDYAARLANRGYVVANVSYRLAGDAAYPASIEDLFGALKFLLENKMRYHLDMTKVFVVGESAGATLSSLFACILTNPSLKKNYPFAFDFKLMGMGLSCGIYDYASFLSDLKWVPYRKATMAEIFMRQDFKNHPLYKSASPLQQMTSDFPSTYLMTSAWDFLSPQTHRLRKKFIQAKIPFVYDYYPLRMMLPHSFHTKFFYPQSKVAMSKMILFFDDLMKSDKTTPFAL